MGQNTPTTAPPSYSRTPFLFQLLTGHRKSSGSPQTIPPKSTQHPQHQNGHNFIATIQPLSTNNSSPHSLRGWSNSTSSQPRPFHAFIAFPLVQLSTRFHWCSLPHYLLWPHLWPRATPTEAPGWGQRWHVIGARPPRVRWHPRAPTNRHCPRMPPPHWGNNTHIHTRTPTAHRC